MQKAAALNPFDTSLTTRIAIKQADAGNADAAIVSFERAIATNPGDEAPRLALLKYLAANLRFTEADVVAKAAIERWPNDPDLLVNQGILAVTLGRPAEAISSWQKAIAVDPAQTLAHVYLADELSREQKFEAAIPHYTLFLERTTKNGARPDPNAVLPVLFKLAECNLRLNRTEQALQIYDAGRKIASQTGHPALESVASLNQAILESKAGTSRRRPSPLSECAQVGPLHQ